MRAFKYYNYLLILLVSKDIKKKYQDSFLGIIWSLLSPLLDMVVLTIVFSTLLSRHVDNYPVYLMTGRLLFQFFTQTTTVSIKTISGASSLIKKIYVPKYILTLSKILSNYVIFLISLVDLVLIMIITGKEMTIYVLYVPVYLILFLVFTAGISFMIATISVFFKDMEHLYKVFTNALYFASAIIYPPEIVPDQYRIILDINPIFHFVQGFRQVAYYGKPINIDNLILCTVISIVSLIVGIYIFKKYQDKFILYI